MVISCVNGVNKYERAAKNKEGERITKKHLVELHRYCSHCGPDYRFCKKKYFNDWHNKETYYIYNE